MHPARMWGMFISVFIVVASAAPIARADQETVEIAKTIGLTPEALVVADCADVAPQILSHLLTASSLCADFTARTDLLQVRLGEASDLSACLLDDPGSDATCTSLIAVVQEIDTIRDALEILRDTARTTATTGLTADEIAGLERWRRASRYRVPAAVRCLDRTDGEWRAIERVFRMHQRAVRTGVPLEDEDATLLASVVNDPAVQACQARLTTQLAQCAAIFNQMSTQGI